MKLLFIAFYALVANLAFDDAGAEDIFKDTHSVESIRAALKTPIPADIQRQAQDFDDTVTRTGQVRDQRVALVTDRRATRADEIVGRLLTAIRLDPSKWVVRVLDTNPPTENAFVVGGRYIYVYTGLINNVRSDDELGVILGHEISHSLLKHGLRRSEDFTNLLASILEISGSMSRSENRKDKFTLMGGAIKAAYSREDEQEADALGVVVANRAGFDTMRGLEFFSRSIRNDNAAQANIQQQLAQARQNSNQAAANCSRFRAQWNSSPLYRTQQNAQIVNSTCQDAQTRINSYNDFVAKYSKASARSVLLRTHPVDQQRISSIIAATDYMKGRRSLDSLSGIGQSYKVFLAISTR